MERFSVHRLLDAYASGDRSVSEVADEVLRRADSPDTDPAIWITRIHGEQVRARAAELDSLLQAGMRLPLHGIPFAVKDNIDVAGMPTTVGCPAYAYSAVEDAPVVRRLLDAGAILIGKTNLDQFATGLTGTRSPYGAPRCVFDDRYLSGGSSSGSAVAVATGLVSFALGTDTAGSGRVPAAFNGIVGLKPSRGRVSTRGVVPACRSLDCVSVFARSTSVAAAVLAVIGGFDPLDPYSRAMPGVDADPGAPKRDGAFRFGVPAREHLRFFGDTESERLYVEALDRLDQVGGTAVEIDYTAFAEAADLLYGGAWVAERHAAVGDFLRSHPNDVHPVVRSIILGADRYSATDLFGDQHRLAELRRLADRAWSDVDVLALPTTGTIYRVDDVMADPYALNANLGYYTNFMNLLDLCGVAVPAGFRASGTPFGITLVGRTFEDETVLHIADRYEAGHRAVRSPEASDSPRPTGGVRSHRPKAIRVAVVGAHLSGEPLNHQLTGRNARLVATTRTAAVYRFYALAGGPPAKPGLVHVGPGGASIEVEVWELDPHAFGELVAEVPPPLAIGSLELEDGSLVKGFVCEPRATTGATEITHHGGWRAYRRSLAGVG